MNPLETTQLLTAAERDDSHLQLLNDTWRLTIFTVLLATALPWFLNAFAIDFGAASCALLAVGAVYVALAAVADLKGPNTVWRTRVLALLHALGVIGIGVVWQYAGGLQNPAFLLALALPVIGATFISRWQPYVTAALAILAVAAVALIQAPELRWYASGLNTAVAWLAPFFGKEGAAGSAPCAMASEYFGTVFEMLRAHVAAARVEAQRGHELWAGLIEHLPVPAVLVEVDTLRVICASERLVPAFGTGDAPLAGRDFFQAIRFSYPEVVEELITGIGGVAPLTVIRVADQLRTADVRVQHLARQGRRFALVMLEDVTEGFCVKAALDAAEHAALVVDSQGSVMGFNRPAQGLFPKAAIGTDISRLFSQPDSDARWWEPGLTGRRKLHVEILQRVYQVTCSTVALPGEEQSIYVIALRPVINTGATNQSARASAAVKPTLVERR
ncbi:MAG: hypothetical protein E6K52_08285 [Gammaproteobacteria bacterium]|nr:MAG: hypothetical protein E6K52_08285 [Gammaproteobacteria bacterium]